MKSSLLPLQTALYNRLSQHMTVYDEVKQGAAMPYVVLGEDTATDAGTKLSPGMEITHTLHVWSDYRGMKEAKELINDITQLLAVPLSVEGFKLHLARLDMIRTMRDPDGYRHGAVRYRFRIYE